MKAIVPGFPTSCSDILTHENCESFKFKFPCPRPPLLVRVYYLYGWVANSHSKQLLGSQRCNGIRFNNNHSIQLSGKIPGSRILYSPAKPYNNNKKVLCVGRDNYQLSYNYNLPQDPFVLTIIKEAIWAMKSLFIFLIEQPSQLKYIEWPSFQSTLKTATLTLVIVALLIVALSSVDSILCYLLALLLRKPA